MKDKIIKEYNTMASALDEAAEMFKYLDLFRTDRTNLSALIQAHKHEKQCRAIMKRIPTEAKSKPNKPIYKPKPKQAA